MIKNIEVLFLSAQMIGDICRCSDNPIQKAKAEAYKAAVGKAKAFLDQGFEEWLVADAVKRRFGYIEVAKTVDELKAITKEPRPHFNGTDYVSGEYYFPEEEAFNWILAGQKSPLKEPGKRRFDQLCKEMFANDEKSASKEF